MKFSEQILEKNSNFIKSYTSSSIAILDKEYNYNIIVPPKNPIIKCNKNSTTITKEFIMNNIIDNVNFVIIGLNNTGCIDKTPIISELNNANIGVEIMSISAACSCHNILLSEQRIFLSFILFN